MYTLYLTLNQAIWLKSQLESWSETFQECADRDMSFEEFDMDSIEELLYNARIAEELADSI